MGHAAFWCILAGSAFQYFLIKRQHMKYPKHSSEEESLFLSWKAEGWCINIHCLNTITTNLFPSQGIKSNKEMSYSQMRPWSTSHWLPFSYLTHRRAGKPNGDSKPLSAVSFLLHSFPFLLTICTPCLLSLGQLCKIKKWESPRPCEHQGEQALAQVPKGLQKPTPHSNIRKKSLACTQPQQKVELKERNENNSFSLENEEHTREPAKRINS